MTAFVVTGTDTDVGKTVFAAALTGADLVLPLDSRPRGSLGCFFDPTLLVDRISHHTGQRQYLVRVLAHRNLSGIELAPLSPHGHQHQQRQAAGAG